MEPDIYQIQTDFFEGPLDLLLHLIRKNKMNILDITISKITSEYLYYLRNATGINPARHLPERFCVRGRRLHAHLHQVPFIAAQDIHPG